MHRFDIGAEEKTVYAGEERGDGGDSLTGGAQDGSVLQVR